MVKVVVIDDSAAIRLSLGRLLSSIPDIEMAGYAEDVCGACSLIDLTRPDVVVLDINLRDGENGIDVLRYVKRHYPSTQVLALSNIASPNLGQIYADAGVSGFFDKSSEFMRARDWIAAYRP